MKLWRRLKGRKGFSLAEMLVTLIILSMLSSVACMGITTALQDRAKAIKVADAQSVASTAAQALADQIRYGRDISVGTDCVALTSSTYGAGVTLKLDGGRLVAQGSGKSYDLLGEKAYSGLSVDGLEFAQSSGAVNIKLSVAGDSGTLWSLEYEVTPLNSLS